MSAETTESFLVPMESTSGSQTPSLSPFSAAILCFALSLAMHIPWLGVTPIAGTEGHRIFPAHEMVVSHNWLVPMMFGRPFMTKPPLHLWLIATSELLVGTHRSDVLAHPSDRDLLAWRLPSALTGAALCAAVCLFGARWFGRAAGLISGLCAVGMIAIWGQSQVADIDSTNTLAAALTALCGIELFIASPAPRAIWIVAASIAMAATWMTKGPAGLTIDAGVWIWGAVVMIREKRSRLLASPAFWLPFAIGAAAMFGWGFAAKSWLHHHGVGIDIRGLKEATHLTFPHSIKGVLSPLLMPPELFGFALPITASLLFFLDRDVRDLMAPAPRRIATALVASVLISWAIAVVSGLFNPLWVNPRYYYPTLLPLCPLAGAIAVAAVRSPRPAAWLRATVVISTLALAGATIGLVVAAWKLPHIHSIAIASVVLAMLITASVIRRINSSWNAAWSLVALVMLTSIPFGGQRRLSRTVRDSGIATAAILRERLGTGAPVAAGGIVTSKPETLTYADVTPTFYYPNYFEPKTVPPGTWVILDQAERKLWRRAGVHLEKETLLCRYGQTDYYLGWYAH